MPTRVPTYPPKTGTKHPLPHAKNQRKLKETTNSRTYYRTLNQLVLGSNPSRGTTPTRVSVKSLTRSAHRKCPPTQKLPLAHLALSSERFPHDMDQDR